MVAGMESQTFLFLAALARLLMVSWLSFLPVVGLTFLAFLPLYSLSQTGFYHRTTPQEEKKLF